ncbi:hypothetical protein, partial [Vibrio owensii]|uniref:hypothetical protein n=1 Tax=Vibrio owensii TaxID=696485 RepID=UPI003AAAAA4D
SPCFLHLSFTISNTIPVQTHRLIGNFLIDDSFLINSNRLPLFGVIILVGVVYKMDGNGREVLETGC